MCHKDKNEFLHPSGTHCVLLAIYCQCPHNTVLTKNFFFLNFFSLFKKNSQTVERLPGEQKGHGWIYLCCIKKCNGKESDI